jgi:hypothetical protein
MTASELTSSRWPLRRVVRAVVVSGVAFGIGAVVGRLVPAEDAPRAVEAAIAVERVADGASPPTLSSAERAILSPLREGSTLAGFRVTAMTRTLDDHALRVVCRRDGLEVRLEVTLAVDGGPPPPALGGPYAVFYTRGSGTPADAEHLAIELANVLRSNGALPIPEHLAPFEPGQP